MSSHPFFADLDFALAAGIRVSIELRNGRLLQYVEVREVDHANFHVIVMTPKTFGDSNSRTRLNIGNITSVEINSIQIK